VARLLPGTIHQYAPVDIRTWVRRFLRHWRPNLAIFVESEIWPVMIDELHDTRIPHLVVNGRMSDRSFRRWRSLGGATKRVFGRIATVIAQSEADAARFTELGAASVEITGNLKFDVPPPAADAAALARLQAAVGSRPFWLAASTHPGEEAIAGEVHRRFRASGADLVTAIAPRHPERGPAVAAELEALGLAPWLKSRGRPLPAQPSVLIFDTLGELGTLYRAAPIAIVGGSLVARGGQNPIEPALLGTAILHGPLTANFADVYASLDAAGGALRIGGADDILRELGRLLSYKAARRRQAEAGSAVVHGLAGALGRTVAAIEPYLAALR
jgi:3-deoxy-D-manno-octulosonic-acid transferase